MKLLFVTLLVGRAIAATGIGGVLSYVKFILPDAGPTPQLKINATQAQIERGRYLANHVNVCMDCHSTRDWTAFQALSHPRNNWERRRAFRPGNGLTGHFFIHATSLLTA